MRTQFLTCVISVKFFAYTKSFHYFCNNNFNLKRNENMNKEILKQNIMAAIKQPTLHYGEIRANGLSESGSEICVRCRPEDSSCVIDVTDNIADDILSKLPAKYAPHLVTIRHDTWISYSYEPVFPTDIQAQWNAEYDAYITDKAAWCAKYGCE